MTLDGKPLTKCDKLAFRKETVAGYIWHNCEVVEIHSTLPVAKVLWFNASQTNPRGYQQWVKLSDLAWEKP